MRRGLLVGGLIALAAISTIAWLSVRYVSEENRAHHLDASLHTLEIRHERLHLSKEASESRLLGRVDRLHEKLRKRERDLRAARAKTNRLERRLEPLGILAHAFLPAGARVDGTRLISGAGGGPLMVVGWHRGHDAPRPSGVGVWRASLGDTGSSPLEWNLVFDARLGRFGASGDPVMTFGPRGRQRTYEWPAEYLSFDTGDATGDGIPDVALVESNSGTGGCRSTRILANEEGGLRQVFHRDTCEGGVLIGHGVLRVKFPLYPKGCDFAHGCGMRLAVLDWNGVSWDRVRGRVLYRSPP